MNIPGYYYDEEKNRYFKITNGAVTSSYHNGHVAKYERQKSIMKQAKRNRAYNDNTVNLIPNDLNNFLDREGSSGRGSRANGYGKSKNGSYGDDMDQDNDGANEVQEYNKQDKTRTPMKSKNQSFNFKLLYLKYSLNNVKLGLTRTNASIIEFERLGHMSLVNDIYHGGLECKMWDKFTIKNDSYIVITDQYRNFMILDVSKLLLHIYTSTNLKLDEFMIDFQDSLNTNVNLMELINKLNLLPFEYLAISSYKNLVFYNFISESDLDNPQIYQNFIRLTVITKVNDRLVKLDKLNHLYQFINNLPDGEIKKDLFHLLGMNVIANVDNDRYEYKPINLKNFKRFFITFSKFIDGFLILGTNLGIIYLIKFQYNPGDAGSTSGVLKFFQDIIKFKFDRSIKLDKISSINKIENYLFITSFKTLIVLNLHTNEKFSFNFPELIKNFSGFKILSTFKLVVISYKKIHILNFSTETNEFETLKDLDIMNDNLINQFSIITLKNNLVINQSHNSLLVLNITNFNSKQIMLEQDNQRINGLMRLSENYLLISLKNSDNTNSFNVYQI